MSTEFITERADQLMSSMLQFYITNSQKKIADAIIRNQAADAMFNENMELETAMSSNSTTTCQLERTAR